MTKRCAFVPVMTLASTPLLSAQGQVTDVPTGPGVGVEVGLINFGGSSDSVIDAGTAYTVLVGYAIRGRLQFNGGVQYSNHGLENVIDRYQVVTAFLESRYRLFSVTLRIQPFIGARVGPEVGERDTQWRELQFRRPSVRWVGGIPLQVGPAIGLGDRVEVHGHCLR